MGSRIRSLIVVCVLGAAGVFVGSAISQWKPLPAQEGRMAISREEALQAMARDIGVGALGRVRVEVLNAGGESGMAREATRFLRDLGFDVVEFGNASSFGADSTVVLDRSGRSQAARAVARALGTHLVREELAPNLYVDVTVLLGGEWQVQSPEPPPLAVGLPWWDVRRFLQ